MIDFESKASAGTVSRRPLNAGEPTTLVGIYQQVVRDYPKHDTLNYKQEGSWRSISAAEMISRARNIAAGLHSLGVRKGDRVAILSESCLEWVLADQGCIFLGAITVPIYPTLTAPQVGYILNDCGARVVFISNEEKLRQMQPTVMTCASLEQVVLFDAAAENLFSLSELETAGARTQSESPQLLEDCARDITPEDLATIIYTSGTTGEPKGVMLTHANMVSNLIDSPADLDFGESDSALSVLPLSHILERQAMNNYLHYGMSVYFAESLDTIGRD